MRLLRRYEAELLDAAGWQVIGRWLGRNPAAERVFDFEFLRDDAHRACGLSITEQADRLVKHVRGRKSSTRKG